MYHFVNVYMSIPCLCRSDGRVHCYSYDEGISYGSLCVSFYLICSVCVRVSMGVRAGERERR